MSLQFVRPEWLIAIIPLLLIVWLMWKRTGSGRVWESVVDPALLPHLLVGKTGQRNRWPLLVFFLAGMLAIIALSGPVWKKLPLPVFKQQSALVIALDLSSSMNAADIKPSRLTRARLKLKDLLNRRTEGQTALIAYAATPYTVSPLTDDTDTIQSLVSSLSSEIMPAQGSRADLAIQQAMELFKNAGLAKGHILLITDGINEMSQQQINNINVNGFPVSVLAVGSEQGAPVPLQSGGYLKDNKGSIVITKTDFNVIRRVASDLGGLYSGLSVDDSDLKTFDALLQQRDVLSQHEQTDFKADRWREEGPWLLLLVIPLAALVFRRGVILLALLVLFILPLPEPAMADGWQWEQLWKNRNQRAQQALQEGEAEQAAKLFDQSDWKAAALYKSEQYEEALQQLEFSNSSEALYNRGNTLARMGRLQDALASYEELLKQQPEHEDALYNRDLVKKALEQQQNQQQNEQDQQQKPDQSPDEQDPQEQDSSNESESQQSDNEPGQASSDSSESEEKQELSEEQKKRLQDAEQKEAEREQAKKEAEQQDAEAQDEKQSQAEAESQLDSIEQLSEQAEQQWLRRIPDDPGGLLRNKFKYQYSRQPQTAREQERW